jgi:hypothetical protein
MPVNRLVRRGTQIRTGRFFQTIFAHGCPAPVPARNFMRLLLSGM